MKTSGVELGQSRSRLHRLLHAICERQRRSMTGDLDDVFRCVGTRRFEEADHRAVDIAQPRKGRAPQLRHFGASGKRRMRSAIERASAPLNFIVTSGRSYSG